jgi:coenzyme F420 hydrogenase subunit beta
VSTGGIGKDNDWTLTVVRTDLGREVIQRMIADGSIIARPADEDPGAIALMHKLSQKSRERWPSFAVDAPRSPNAKPTAKSKSKATATS